MRGSFLHTRPSRRTLRSQEWDTELCSVLAKRNIDLVVLAGFMRILTVRRTDRATCAAEWCARVTVLQAVSLARGDAKGRAR